MQNYVVTFFYSGEDSEDFDLDYYLQSHIPAITEKVWKPYGMLSWQVIDLRQESAGHDHKIQTMLYWKSAKDFKAAWTSDELKEFLENMKKYSKTFPSSVAGILVGESVIKDSSK